MQEYQNYDHYKGKKIITKLITTRWCSQSWTHRPKPLAEPGLDLTWRIILLIITEFMNGCYQMSMIFTVWWLLCSPWSKLAWHPKRLNVLYIRTHCYIILRSARYFQFGRHCFYEAVCIWAIFQFQCIQRRKKLEIALERALHSALVHREQSGLGLIQQRIYIWPMFVFVLGPYLCLKLSHIFIWALPIFVFYLPHIFTWPISIFVFDPYLYL